MEKIVPEIVAGLRRRDAKRGGAGVEPDADSSGVEGAKAEGSKDCDGEPFEAAKTIAVGGVEGTVEEWRFWFYCASQSLLGQMAAAGQDPATICAAQSDLATIACRLQIIPPPLKVSPITGKADGDKARQVEAAVGALFNEMRAAIAKGPKILTLNGGLPLMG